MKNILILGAVIIVVLAGILFFTNNDENQPTVESEPAPVESNRPPITEGSFTVEQVDVAEDSEQVDLTSMDKGGNESLVGLDSESIAEISVESEVNTFNISGVNFAFDVTEMRVKEGDTVTVNFTSADGYHDWVVDAFDAATAKVDAGGSTSVTFVASKKGTYEYYCSVGSHRAKGMVGTLIVE